MLEARHGAPRYPPEPPAGITPEAFAVEQERAVLERSIAYCHDQFGGQYVNGVGKAAIAR